MTPMSAGGPESIYRRKPQELRTPEQVTTALKNATSVENFQKSLDQAKRTMGSEDYMRLHEEIHQAVLEYYNNVGYSDPNKAVPEAVPNFLRQAEASEILAVAQILNDNKHVDEKLVKRFS